MINIFENSKKLLKNINNPDKKYWENNHIDWNKEATHPDKNIGTYDEQLMYESIKQSDRNRLLRFS